MHETWHFALFRLFVSVDNVGESYTINKVIFIAIQSNVCDIDDVKMVRNKMKIDESIEFTYNLPKSMLFTHIVCMVVTSFDAQDLLFVYFHFWRREKERI